MCQLQARLERPMHSIHFQPEPQGDYVTESAQSANIVVI